MVGLIGKRLTALVTHMAPRTGPLEFINDGEMVRARQAQWTAWLCAGGSLSCTLGMTLSAP
jgi:hypothetical protein